MRTRMWKALMVGAAFSCSPIFVHATDGDLKVKYLGDGQSIVRPEQSKKYLLLPVEDKAGEAKLYMISDNDVVRTLNVRLAVNRVDYFVPLELTGYEATSLGFNIQMVPDSAVCWKEMKLSDSFDTSNREAYRPTYHFAPEYGWMNDPNGMIYKDGEYHLFYQYNPYGSTWGNMHWGHAVTRDLVTWEHLPVAIAPDGLGSIFSGSAVLDKNNTAGFGKDAIVAFYTSAGERQSQSMAYSLDNGRTFKKYERNPVITSTVRDFRDPKVFWHEATRRWVMILAAGQEMQIYSSANLKEWAMESKFGEGYGAHGGVWECPDLIQLPIEGTELKKWVLICNLNPGGLFGGSATQYFTGEFDGKKFTCDSEPEVTKWMDFGKDHYATVTWSNAPQGRHIALAWMSNWEYANDVPTRQFRSANSVPRDLYLYTHEGETYMASRPSDELKALRGKAVKKGGFRVSPLRNIDRLFSNNQGAYEIGLTLKSTTAKVMGFKLYNAQGEEVEFTYDLDSLTLSMDRTRSGKTDFSKTFAAVTKAPLKKQGEYKLRIYVDKSVEVFGGDGKICMTNLVFPSEPYNSMSFFAKGGKFAVSNLTIYPLNKK